MINAVLQFLQMCRNIRIKFLSWVSMYTTLTFLGTRVIQTNPSKFDKRLFPDIYLCRLRLKQGREIHDLIFSGREYQRDAPVKDMLVLNKSSFGLGM